MQFHLVLKSKVTEVHCKFRFTLPTTMAKGRKRAKRSDAREEALGIEPVQQPKTQEELDLEAKLFGNQKLAPTPDKGNQRAGAQDETEEDEGLLEVADDQVALPEMRSARTKHRLTRFCSSSL